LTLAQFEPGRYDDPKLRSFAAKQVEVRAEPSVGGSQATVDIAMTDGATLSARCEHPLGAFENPVSRAQIEQKFRTYAQGFLPDSQIADAIGAGGGEVAILSAAATAENQNAWIGFMKEELKNHPELKLVDTVYGDDDAAKSAEKAAALLQSHPNLKGIISPTTVGVAAAAKYISGSQYKGKVQVTGLGLPSEMKAYVTDGTVKTFGLWDPGMLGYLGVYAAGLKASGADVKTAGITAGGKSYTLDKDGVVVVGPPQDFNAQNIDQFKF